ncbi:MAG: hypothetical protein AB7L84_00515 [Acidimicrobiia bacterium]
MAQPAVTGSPSDWQRVGGRVLDRRLELGLGQDELGVSKSVASNLENGKQTSYARSSLARVARALQWTPESVELVLQGREPVAIGPQSPGGPPLEIDLRGLSRRVEELADEIRELRRALEDRPGLALAARSGDRRGPGGTERARPGSGHAPGDQHDA